VTLNPYLLRMEADMQSITPARRDLRRPMDMPILPAREKAIYGDSRVIYTVAQGDPCNSSISRPNSLRQSPT
jgi:hypothetical protein